jgi:hypothetical protein
MTRLWFKVGERYACVPAKCGGTAFYRRAFGILDGPDSHVFSAALLRAQPYLPDEVAAFDGPKWLAVREPLSRFKSLWRDKCCTLDVNVPMLHGLTPDELIGLIERDPFGDSHWMPQFKYLTPGVRLVPYRKMFQVLGFEPLEANVGSQGAEPQFPVERILSMYGVDALLHRGAMGA